jgi:hypothetical protein
MNQSYRTSDDVFRSRSENLIRRESKLQPPRIRDDLAKTAITDVLGWQEPALLECDDVTVLDATAHADTIPLR